MFKTALSPLQVNQLVAECQQLEEERQRELGQGGSANADSAPALRLQLEQTQRQLADSDALVRQQASVVAELERRLLQHQEGRLLGAAAAGQGVDAAAAAGSASALASGEVARLQAVLRRREEQHRRQLRAAAQEHARLRVEQEIRWVG